LPRLTHSLLHYTSFDCIPLYYRACISRCYYAIYCTVQALLIVKNINTRSHRGVRQQFSQHFIQTGELPLELSKALRITYDLRQLGDYDQVVEITREQTRIALEYATVFVEQASNWLSTH